MQESIVNRDNPLYSKSEGGLNDFEGKPLYPEVITGFHIGTESKPEADSITSFQNMSKLNITVHWSTKRNIAFAEVILPATTCIQYLCITTSLERRKTSEGLRGKSHASSENMIMNDYDTVEDLSEEERWEQEENGNVSAWQKPEKN